MVFFALTKLQLWQKYKKNPMLTAVQDENPLNECQHKI
jgi:hypothetical protein